MHEAISQVSGVGTGVTGTGVGTGAGVGLVSGSDKQTINRLQKNIQLTTKLVGHVS